MKILMSTSGSEDRPSFMILELDEAAKKAILARRELLEMVRSKDDTIQTFETWNCPCEFYDFDVLDALDLEDDEREALEEGDTLFITLEDSFEPGVEPARTECDREVIGEDGVYWRSFVKNTDCYVESMELPYEELLKSEPEGAKKS